MKVLVIPDIHLKLFMFIPAEKIMESGKADMAIFLGDLPDDFGCAGNTMLYKETFDRCIKFKEKFPNTKYCYGNHEMAYWLARPCTGTDMYNLGFVANLIRSLKRVYGEDAQVVHRIDNCLFSHAGITNNWICKYFSRELENGISDNDLLERINYLDDKDCRLWEDSSPIWARPQHQDGVSKHDRLYLWKPEQYLQVVGHTPLIHPEQEQNLLSCDAFSTYTDGSMYGMQEFVIVDTNKQTWEIVNE